MSCVSGACQTLGGGARYCKSDEACGAGNFCDTADGQCKPVFVGNMGPTNMTMSGDDAGANVMNPIDSGTTTSGDLDATTAPDADSTPDAASLQDAAAASPDAGSPPAADAAPLSDASAAPDAAPAPADAAPAAPDAAPATPDAAPSAPDAATPPPDAGMPVNQALGASCTADQECATGLCLGLSVGMMSYQI